ncbi:hypothetical protein D3C81_1406900 [compost metagenome]
MGAFVAVFLEPRMVNRDVFASTNLEAGGIATEVDRIAATALGLAADRAVAALVRVGVGAVQTERHRAAMAGTFELHGSLRLSGTYPEQPRPSGLLDRHQNRVAGRHQFQLITGLREQLGAGKYLFLAGLHHSAPGDEHFTDRRCQAVH